MQGKKIEICDIDKDTFSEGYIAGVVTLRWPYSSSQRQITLQLADEDARRRGDKGQLRITFNGAAADALKDVASLASLKLHANTDEVRFDVHKGSKRDCDWNLTFIGDVLVDNGVKEITYDSHPVKTDLTPAKIKRTWQTPDLKRTAPDELGLEDAWFSQDSTNTKRQRYSFKLPNNEQEVDSPVASQLSTGFKSQTFTFQTPSAPVRIDKELEMQDNEEPQTVATQVPAISEPASEQGDAEGTPGVGPQHSFSHISAPPTPRNVPYLSLESADEQEDLFRKLRASAPPKSEAGSSMVADEDDEAGNLADDPNPTILETQSRIQEGILRRKISEDERGIQLNPETLEGSIRPNSVEPVNHSSDAVRIRAPSPSMTERGAAVQESVFRSKIKSDESDHQSLKSVKSSVLVEPAAASVDGSVREVPDRTLLDQQASVQETLFREKLDNPANQSSLSLIGAQAPSAIGDVAVNQEPSMLEQQADVQETIFRDKVDHTTEDQISGPASLDHMEARASALASGSLPSVTQSTARTIEEFNERTQEGIQDNDNQEPPDELVETVAADAQEPLEVQAVPDAGALEDFHDFEDESSEAGSVQSDPVDTPVEHQDEFLEESSIEQEQDDSGSELEAMHPDDTIQAFHGSSPAAPIEIDEESEIEADDISQLMDQHDRDMHGFEASANDQFEPAFESEEQYPDQIEDYDEAQENGIDQGDEDDSSEDEHSENIENHIDHDGQIELESEVSPGAQRSPRSEPAVDAKPDLLADHGTDDQQPGEIGAASGDQDIALYEDNAGKSDDLTLKDDVPAPTSDLTTKLGYHVAIAALQIERIVDIIGIIFDPQTAKTRGPDHVMSATLCQPAGHCRLMIFRYKDLLPRFEPGTAVLLRSFQVGSFARELFLKSRPDSSWQALSSLQGFADHGNEELAHALKLEAWWSAQPKPSPKLKKQITLAQMKPDTFFDLACTLVDLPISAAQPLTITVKDEHGELKIDLRRQDASYARKYLKVADKLLCRNILIQDDPTTGHIEPDITGKPSITKL